MESAPRLLDDVIGELEGLATSTDEDEATRALCTASLYEFVCEFWETVEHEPLIKNWHLRAICDEIQVAVERVFRREPRQYDLVINVPPGSSKSTIGSVMLPVWALVRMRECQTICGSYTDALAQNLARKSLDVMNSDKFKRVFPECELRGPRPATGFFLTREGGFRYATSTNSTMTGFHAHIIVIDDPLDPKRAASEVELLNAQRWVTETIPSRKVNQTFSLTILIMQRLHDKDPSGLMLKRADVRHVCLPAELSEDVRPRRYAREYVGGLLDPVRLPRSVLDNMRFHVLLEFGYVGQYLQRPTAREGGQFKVERLVLDTPPPPHRFVKRVRSWDKAGTEDGGAFTAGTLLGKDDTGRVWVLHVVRGQWDSARREGMILLTAEADGKDVVVVVEQEGGSGGKESAQNTVKMLSGWTVRVVHPTGAKELRADPFSTQVNAGNVSVVKDQEWTQPYIDELRSFPRGTFKDQVDASAHGFTALTTGTDVGILDHG